MQEDIDKDNRRKNLSLLKLIRDRIDFFQNKQYIDNYIIQKLREGENYEILSDSVGLSSRYILSICKRYDYRMYCSILSDIHRKKLLKKHKKINYNFK